jgi:hypothetical protein
VLHVLLLLPAQPHVCVCVCLCRRLPPPCVGLHLTSALCSALCAVWCGADRSRKRQSIRSSFAGFAVSRMSRALPPPTRCSRCPPTSTSPTSTPICARSSVDPSARCVLCALTALCTACGTTAPAPASRTDRCRCPPTPLRPRARRSRRVLCCRRRSALRSADRRFRCIRLICRPLRPPPLPPLRLRPPPPAQV